MTKHLAKLGTLIATIAILASCNSTKRVTYLQDVTNESIISLAGNGQIRIKPHDRLTVIVSSKDPELAAPFNTTTSYSSLSSNPLASTNPTSAQALQIRTVDEKGDLYIPVIGVVHCAGKTRSELASEIAHKIIDGGYISDASVNIQFADMKFYVLGEVVRPGQFDITRDKITLLEALAMAGDMTIYGNRTNVSVIRKEEGKDQSKVYQVDLLSKDALLSPAFNLQQGDVVYVQPNKYKAATSEINQNRTFWISIASTLLTAASLALTIVSFATR
ncbi:MAG: polysaccharide biosynthesis/export family protein [Alistipes sp.]|nr:polysaccharide biosynthesis/export family protein [Alistipes sp.]